MYRITRIDDRPRPGDITLRVEGHLGEEAAAELVRTVGGLASPLDRLSLDLSGLRYAEKAAVEAICGYIARGVPVRCGSPFVKELLKECHS